MIVERRGSSKSVCQSRGFKKFVVFKNIIEIKKNKGDH
jgi:hypothetical protein